MTTIDMGQTRSDFDFDSEHDFELAALASSMHQHVTAFTAWRYRRGLPGAEATLRRIAAEGVVLVSTGGADFTHPRGTARKLATAGGCSHGSKTGDRPRGPRDLRSPFNAEATLIHGGQLALGVQPKPA